MPPTDTKQAPLPTPTPTQPTFRQLVQDAVMKHGDRDREPRLPTSTIFHRLKELGLWEELAKKEIRKRVKARLCLAGWLKTAANLKSWRMLEDAIYVSEGFRGNVDIEQLKGELEGLRAYADDERYPESPSDEERAATLADAKKVFGDGFGLKSHLPTTIMHFYKRLGLWKEAVACWMAVERESLIEGDSPDSAKAVAWRDLATALEVGESADGIFETLVAPALGFDMGTTASVVQFVGTAKPAESVVVQPDGDDADDSGDEDDAGG